MKKLLIQNTIDANDSVLTGILQKEYELVFFDMDSDSRFIMDGETEAVAVILDFESSNEVDSSTLTKLCAVMNQGPAAVIAVVESDNHQGELSALRHGIPTLIKTPFDEELILLQLRSAIKRSQEHSRVLRQLDASQRKLETTMANVECGIVILQVGTDGNLKLDYFNECMCRMMHSTPERMWAMACHDPFAPVHPADRDYVKRQFLQRMNENQKFSETYRLVFEEDHCCWVHMEASMFKNELGERVYYCVYTDVNKEKIALEKALIADQKLKAAQKQMQATIDNVECGIVVMQARSDRKIGVTYVNDGACRILRMSENDLLSQTADDAFAILHPHDRGPITRTFQNSIRSQEKFSETFRVEVDQGDYLWVHMDSNVLENEFGEVIYYCVFTDITKEKEDRERVLLRDAAVNIAVEQTGIVFWTLDLESAQVTYDGRSHRYQNEENKNWADNKDLIHPDDRDEVVAYFDAVFAGQAPPPIEARLLRNDKKEYFWAKITHTLLEDENGQPVKAVGSSLDITEQKRLEDAFNEQMSFRNILEQKVSSYCRLNLTQNLLIPGTVSIDELKHIFNVKTADEFLALTASYVPDQEQKATYETIFRRGSMLDAFSAGKTRLRLEHKSSGNPQKIDWIETHTNIMKNPRTGDIEALFFTFDIDDTKTTQLLFDTVVNTEYDYLSTIDMKHDVYRMYSHNDEATSVPMPLGSFTEIRDTHAETLISEATRDEYLRQLDYGNIRKRLETEEQYSFSFETIEEDGSLRTRKMKLFYMDRDAEILCAVRRDVTDILHEEQQKAEILRNALEAAKQASTAKTDFLSRMSHEIRTPMNAIIGMTTIASQSLGDDRQIADCLSKIGISSRFLLTLINDILDMSRIESGKALLKNEKIPFEEFINGINSICCTQAQAKDVDYENIVDAQLDSYYIGDAMKLQQVLINILSNAVKFTPTGGKVTFQVREKKRVKDNAVLEFVINDTGCGMSEEFIPLLFEPFSQEHSGSTTIYGGTGLGMAICKSFVDLMDGHISVRSMLGIGSEFVVDVKLGITNESKMLRASKSSYNFSKLNALVVDDDVAVCQQAVLTLKEIGLKSSWVDSGQQAIDLVEKKWRAKQFFDLILIDWKMPELDGIETARRIRKIVGPDVTIIIITAYDWVAIEQEAKNAGVNLLVSKPLFKSSLVSAFQKAFDQKEETEAPVEQVFDFSGKRVLLAEDHPLNTEIATFLLNSKGMTVEHAENGVKAVEMFTLAEAGYYDAILMDIRMPIMDGLQATVSIRHLNKEGARTIPIIAMTADAFEEDVTKSKQAGMNAHLAKPINPEDLYTTLHRFIFKEEQPSI